MRTPKLPRAAKHDAALGPELWPPSSARASATALIEPRPAAGASRSTGCGRASASWYELFPRSWGGCSGVQSAAAARWPSSASTSLYLPPIHPIGLTNRKGRNNALTAGPGDPGSPWAIGDASGGHDAVHPELGTIEDVRALTADRRASSASTSRSTSRSSARPTTVADASIRSGSTAAPTARSSTPRTRPSATRTSTTSTGTARTGAALWEALLDVVLDWVDCGVKVFRVDNPHTKPFAFWEWLIDAGARPRPRGRLPGRGIHPPGGDAPPGEDRLQPVLHVLHLEELALGADRVRVRAGLLRRAGVLPPELLRQHARHPARLPRSTAAGRRSRRGWCWRRRSARATAIYSGFEHVENVPVREGSEEYLDSEKYEIKERALDGELLPLIGRLNHIRRAHPALQELRTSRSSTPRTRRSSPTPSGPARTR